MSLCQVQSLSGEFWGQCRDNVRVPVSGKVGENATIIKVSLTVFIFLTLQVPEKPRTFMSGKAASD